MPVLGLRIGQGKATQEENQSRHYLPTDQYAGLEPPIDLKQHRSSNLLLLYCMLLYKI